MVEQIQKYFTAEKTESLLFILIGIASLVCAIRLYPLYSQFYKGIAIVFFIVGLIQLVVGASVFFRTDKQLSHLRALYESNSSQYKIEELTRMKKVNLWFDRYKIIEIALLIIGLGLFFGLRGTMQITWLGVGAGLVVQSLLMLIFDFFAERRADIYTSLIEKL